MVAWRGGRDPRRRRRTATRHTTTPKHGAPRARGARGRRAPRPEPLATQFGGLNKNELVQDKVEGMAIAEDGTVWMVSDNDGVDDASGETYLWSFKLD